MRDGHAARHLRRGKAGEAAHAALIDAPGVVGEAVVRLLEVGTRTTEETATYSDIDMMYREDASTNDYFTKDGRPLE